MRTLAEFLDVIGLSALMKLTSGKPEIVVGLVDGPIFKGHPELVSEKIREIPGRSSSSCARTESVACMHGTYVAGILSAKRGSSAPAICPDCILLPRPIFAESTSGMDKMPSATPEELASAIINCVEAGARVINLSVGLAHLSSKGERELDEALNYATRRGVIVVAAAGNQGTVGSSVLTRHPWVIPVVACDSNGMPVSEANLGSSIGRRGLRAPGDAITSLGTDGQPLTLGGTSVAAPFVSGAIALLFSLNPSLSGQQMKLALAQAHLNGKRSIVPPLLNASAIWGLIQSKIGLN